MPSDDSKLTSARHAPVHARRAHRPACCSAPKHALVELHLQKRDCPTDRCPLSDGSGVVHPTNAPHNLGNLPGFYSHPVSARRSAKAAGLPASCPLCYIYARSRHLPARAAQAER